MKTERLSAAITNLLTNGEQGFLLVKLRYGKVGDSRVMAEFRSAQLSCVPYSCGRVAQSRVLLSTVQLKYCIVNFRKVM